MTVPSESPAKPSLPAQIMHPTDADYETPCRRNSNDD
jgi:hypothetical protein